MNADRLRGSMLFAGAVAVAIAIGLGFIAVSGVLVSATTGADPADAFQPADLVPGDIDDWVSWNPQRGELLRDVEPQTRDAVASAWVRADAATSYALNHGDFRPLETWYTEGALERAKALLSEPSATEGVVWDHHDLEATFYSIDGRIIGLDVVSAGVLSSDGLDVPVRENRQAVLVLTDGNWRIQRVRVTETNVGNSTVS